MDNQSILFICIICGYIISLAISIWIMHAVVRSATRSNEILRYQKVQAELLVVIARQGGLNDDDLEQLIDNIDNPEQQEEEDDDDGSTEE